jgi:hypothetical protein
VANVLLHSMATAWTSSNAAVLSAAADLANSVDGNGGNRLVATSGALNAYVEWLPIAPLDLGRFDELRFWVLGTRPADGGASAPFYLELSYTDVNDAPGEEHRFYVPVNRAGVWEQRRIGIAGDRRSAVNRLRFRCLIGLPFTCFLDEILAVREEMLKDAEDALSARLSQGIAFEGAYQVPLKQTANAGDKKLFVPLSTAFVANNRVLLAGSAPSTEEHTLLSVTHDTATDTTTLQLDAADAVITTRAAGAGNVTLLAPVIADVAYGAGGAPMLKPAILLTLLESREDPMRTSRHTQRDTFRPRPAGLASSVRPSAQAYFIDYQITAVAPSRRQQLHLYDHIVGRLRGFGPTGTAEAIRINGAPAPLVQMPSPPLDERQTGDPTALFLRIHTRREVAPRVEVPGVVTTTITSGQLASPLSGSSPVAPVPGPEPGSPPGVDPTDTEPIVVQVPPG